MVFSYKKVLIIGATSGIGKTLADKVITNGSKLIVAGRRKENLDAIVQLHGGDKVSAKAFDVMQLEQVRPIKQARQFLNSHSQTRSLNSLQRSSPRTPIWTASS